ncbi:hypothetical protein HPS54_09140 [Prevotella sp. PCHR]|uniref:Lipoprotein n=1 Tax=Xylanibacter caecicola TaxID=2736294 RepID=A0ABX2B4R6_9BACT|nr:hypothetical protein [Xylanibacter caecicola]NPE25675.1 hypothetical protein [Xylanibacter caecicola]
MKNVKWMLAFPVFALLVVACNDTKNKPAGGPEFVTEAVEVEDTTIYGRCGEGTAMHTLELITDKGDTLTLAVDTEDGEDVVRGGLLVGDRLAVTAFRNADGDNVASRVLNLTTLLGTWTSIDRRFELQEGGAVISNVTEPHPYTEWSIHNGRLVISADTFDIYSLGPDSLCLENNKGIYAYKRMIK